MNNKQIGIGIVASLFLIPTAYGAFWDSWFSVAKHQSDYNSQVELVNDQVESVRSLDIAKKLADTNLNNALSQLRRLQKKKFLAHCSLYAAKKNSGETPKDSRIEPACDLDDKGGDGLSLYKKIYLEDFSTVKKN